MFDGLGEYQIVRVGSPVVDPEGYTAEDLASRHREQAAAAASVERVNDLEAAAPAHTGE